MPGGFRVIAQRIVGAIMSAAAFLPSVRGPSHQLGHQQQIFKLEGLADRRMRPPGGQSVQAADGLIQFAAVAYHSDPLPHQPADFGGSGEGAF